MKTIIQDELVENLDAAALLCSFFDAYSWVYLVNKCVRPKKYGFFPAHQPGETVPLKWSGHPLLIPNKELIIELY